jgi:surfeit locus 1 family protein
LQLNWKVTTFSVVFLAVFVHLGFWQLERAEQKIELLAAQEQRAQGPGRSFPVALFGRYRSGQVFLLDNRVLNGQVGFEVLVPFADDASGQVALINRGFVAMGRTRSELPEIPALAPDHGEAIGTVYVAEGAGDAANMVAEGPGNTMIVQVADPGLIADRFDAPVYEHLIRLAVDDINALPRHWPVTVMTPATHRGYAAQWFVMALAVSIAWAIFTFRRPHRQQEEDSE